MSSPPPPYVPRKPQQTTFYTRETVREDGSAVLEMVVLKGTSYSANAEVKGRIENIIANFMKIPPKPLKSIKQISTNVLAMPSWQEVCPFAIPLIIVISFFFCVEYGIDYRIGLTLDHLRNPVPPFFNFKPPHQPGSYPPFGYDGNSGMDFIFIFAFPVLAFLGLIFWG